MWHTLISLGVLVYNTGCCFLISSVLHWLIPPSKDLFVTDDAFEWIVFWLFALPIIRKGGLYDLLQFSLTTMRWFIRAKPHYVLHANICGGKKFLYQVISNLFSCRHCNDNKTETRRTELQWTFSLNVHVCTIHVLVLVPRNILVSTWELKLRVSCGVLKSEK